MREGIQYNAVRPATDPCPLAADDLQRGRSTLKK
jgi:hypothetical protein